MDYCITGGNGFIGTNLVDYLQRKGKSIKVIDLRSGMSFSSLCIDVSARLPQFSHDILVHLAAETNVRMSIEVPNHTIVRNINGILNCLNHVKEQKANKLIFTSSVSSSDCKSPYLASKMACEAICNSYKCSYNLDIKVLRLSNVYGPNSLLKESVIPKFIKNCLDKQPITIYGDGSQCRDFIHVDDVVRCIYEETDGYIATGRLTSIKSIANMISDISEKLIGYRPRIVYENAICGEVNKPIPRTDIWTTVKIDEGLVNTFEWFRHNYATSTK